MRLRIVHWVVLAAMLLLWLPAVSGAENSGELCVMTFNLRYASSSPPNAWFQRRPVTRQLIQNESPDVIGTQEGLYQQAKDLQDDLPAYGWIGLGREGGSRGEFMAVFYRRERLEPLEFDHFWLSDTPERIGSKTWGNTLPRMVTWVKFRDRRTNEQFYFFNTHFDHQSQESREGSASLVLARVRNLQTALPVLLVGDFNAEAGANKVYELLVKKDGFVDTWLAALRRGEGVGTFHDYRGPSKGGARIDWVLSRGPVKTIRSEVVTYAADGQYPSDHFPVTARLQLHPER